MDVVELPDLGVADGVAVDAGRTRSGRAIVGDVVIRNLRRDGDFILLHNIRLFWMQIQFVVGRAAARSKPQFDSRHFRADD